MPNWEGPTKRGCAPRNADSIIEARRRRLYKHQLDGKSVRQIVYDHQKREGISMTTAYRDWAQVQEWVSEDWKKDRENMLERIQAMRMGLYYTAVKNGQYQTAAQILDSLGRVLGEATPEQVSISVPSLNIQIEPQNNAGTLPEAPEMKTIDAETVQEVDYESTDTRE